MENDELIKSALNAHNRLREIHGAPPLIHNPDLSRIAQNWSNQQAKSNMMKHSNSDWNGKRLGENLACGTQGVYGRSDDEIGQSGY